MIEVQYASNDAWDKNTPAPRSVKTGMGRMNQHKKGVGRMSSGIKPKHLTSETANACIELFGKGYTLRRIASCLDLYPDEVAHLFLSYQEFLKKEEALGEDSGE